MIVPFEFADLTAYTAPTNSFVLRVPIEIKFKVDLFGTLAREGKFPDYFGANWDALVDCLCDFSWISEKQIVMIHDDVPLRPNVGDCFNYLDSLRIAVDDWTKTKGTTENKISVDHKLQVVFPVSAQNTVLNVLQNK